MQRPHRFPQLASLALLLVALGYLAWLGWGLLPQNSASSVGFDGEQALKLARTQCDMGPRVAGSTQDWALGDSIAESLTESGWKIAVEEYAVESMQLRNIAALAGDSGPLLVIAAHYDSHKSLPGVNDGAVGTATLLELARVLDISKLEHRVWLLFLDGEATANWPETSGARHFIQGRKPAAVIYLNQIGAGEGFHQIPDVNQLLQRQLWGDARRLGYEDVFIPEETEATHDAHLLFAEAGIPVAEITQDAVLETCEAFQPEPMQAVGTLLESYLENNHFLSVSTSLVGK